MRVMCNGERYNYWTAQIGCLLWEPIYCSRPNRKSCFTYELNKSVLQFNFIHIWPKSDRLWQVLWWKHLLNEYTVIVQVTMNQWEFWNPFLREIGFHHPPFQWIKLQRQCATNSSRVAITSSAYRLSASHLPASWPNMTSKKIDKICLTLSN